MPGSGEVLQLPNPPQPMTASMLMGYLEFVADESAVEDQPVLIDGEPIAGAEVVDGRVVLRTWLDMLRANPPCDNHIPLQHRDRKPPWCSSCGLTADWANPHQKLE